MHESLAKAQAKGALRNTKINMDRLEKDWWVTAKRNRGNWGKKITLEIMDYFCDRHGDLLLMKKSYSRRASWHIDLINAHLSLHHDTFENIGTIYPLIIEKISSRKFLKSVDGSHELLLEPQIGVHEHFIQRAIQRAGWPNNSNLKEQLVDIALALSLQLPDLRYGSSDTTSIHACLADYVVVSTYHKARGIFVLNTLISKSKFTCAQAVKYEECYKKREQGAEFPILLSELDFRPIGAKYQPRTYKDLIESCERIKNTLGYS